MADSKHQKFTFSTLKTAFRRLRFFAGVGFVVVGASSFLNAYWNSTRVPPEVILKIDYKGISEVSETSRIFGRETRNLHVYINAIQKAKNDPRVKALYATLPYQMTEASLAELYELREAIADFKTSGKPTIIYGSTYSQNQYLLASAFSKVYMQPSGYLNLVGTNSFVPFFRGLLDKIGVEIDYGARREYKVAINSIVKREFTSEHREATEYVVKGFAELISSNILQRNNLKSKYGSYVEIFRGPFYANDPIVSDFVDGLKYENEVEEELKDLLTESQTKILKEKAFIPLSHYYFKTLRKPKKQDYKIALIYASGAIDGSKNPSTINFESFKKAFKQISRDPKIKGVVIRVDSPGGDAILSDAIRNLIENAKKDGLKVIASTGSVAASGGYEIIVNCNRIVSNPFCITGSIGVFGLKPSFQGLLEKIGVNVEEVCEGESANFWSPINKFDENGQMRFQGFLDFHYNFFKEKVAQGRNLPIEKVEDIARGRIFFSRDALSEGLIDEIGTLSRAIDITKKECGLEEASVVVFPKKSLQDYLIEMRKRMFLIEHLALSFDRITSIVQGSFGTSIMKWIPPFWTEREKK